jgi:hypothetical protein
MKGRKVFDIRVKSTGYDEAAEVVRITSIRPPHPDATLIGNEGLPKGMDTVRLILHLANSREAAEFYVGRRIRLTIEPLDDGE